MAIWLFLNELVERVIIELMTCNKPQRAGGKRHTHDTTGLARQNIFTFITAYCVTEVQAKISKSYNLFIYFVVAY